MEYKRLTDDELADFLQRACVQLTPELTQQLLSLGVELTEYRAKIEQGTLKEITENAVVLTQEEWAEHNEMFAKAMYQKEINTRKETVEKFFDELYTWLDLEEIEKYGFVHIQKFDFLRKFREIHTKIVGVQQGVKDED